MVNKIHLQKEVARRQPTEMIGHRFRIGHLMLPRSEIVIHVAYVLVQLNYMPTLLESVRYPPRTNGIANANNTFQRSRMISRARHCFDWRLLNLLRRLLGGGLLVLGES
jgi:hypothetical protein